jgi:hypothetical protein
MNQKLLKSIKAIAPLGRILSYAAPLCLINRRRVGIIPIKSVKEWLSALKLGDLGALALGHAQLGDQSECRAFQ